MCTILYGALGGKMFGQCFLLASSVLSLINATALFYEGNNSPLSRLFCLLLVPLRLGRKLAAMARAVPQWLDHGDQSALHLEQNRKCSLVHATARDRPRHSDHLGRFGFCDEPG